MQVADKFGRTPGSSRSPSAESGTRFEFDIVTADRTWEVAVAQYATLTASLSTLNTFRISRVDAMSHQFARLADKPYVEVSRTEAARSGASASDGASHQTCSLPLEWLIPPTFTFGAA
ncbi:MAG: hypothetical protein EOO65_05435 [Methanosarcinales archaeon]|nr:MAG: hypothetical protein EOO65_05435 [Methanosarcinales archaeon]